MDKDQNEAIERISRLEKSLTLTPQLDAVRRDLDDLQTAVDLYREARTQQVFRAGKEKPETLQAASMDAAVLLYRAVMDLPEIRSAKNLTEATPANEKQDPPRNSSVIPIPAEKLKTVPHPSVAPPPTPPPSAPPLTVTDLGRIVAATAPVQVQKTEPPKPAPKSFGDQIASLPINTNRSVAQRVPTLKTFSGRWPLLVIGEREDPKLLRQLADEGYDAQIEWIPTYDRQSPRERMRDVSRKILNSKYCGAVILQRACGAEGSNRIAKACGEIGVPYQTVFNASRQSMIDALTKIDARLIEVQKLSSATR